MKCSRCGWCCTTLCVVVVNDPELGVIEGNLITVGFKGPERCPHLRGDAPGNYSCAVHDRPWYPQTPCAEYQSHWEDRPCPMGEFMVERSS